MIERVTDTLPTGLLGESRVRAGLLITLLVGAAVLPFLLRSSLLFTVTLVVIYALIAFSAIIPIGYLGQLILCQGAFVGIGAYGFIKFVDLGVPSWVALALAAVVTAVIAYIIGQIAITTHEIQLGIVTLAFNELFVIGMELFPDFMGGSTGVAAPDLAFPGWLPVGDDIMYYYVAIAFYAVAFMVLRRFLTAETGWAFLTIREDRVVAESIGIDSRKYRVRSFVLAGAAGGIGGALYAPVIGYISPPAFGIAQSIDVILIGVLGGITVPFGGILGAPVAVLLPEVLDVVSEYRTVIYGVLLVVLLIYVPGGIGGWLEDRFDR